MNGEILENLKRSIDTEFVKDFNDSYNHVNKYFDSFRRSQNMYNGEWFKELTKNRGYNGIDEGIYTDMFSYYDVRNNNYIKEQVDRIISDLVTYDFKPELEAASKKGEEDKRETLGKEVLDAIWDEKEIDYLIKKAIHSSLTAKHSVLHVWKYADKKGKPNFKVTEIPFNRFFWDPTATRMQDASFAIWTQNVNEETLKSCQMYDWNKNQGKFMALKKKIKKTGGTTFLSKTTTPDPRYGNYLDMDYGTMYAPGIYKVSHYYKKHTLPNGKTVVSYAVFVEDELVNLEIDYGTSTLPFVIFRAKEKVDSFVWVSVADELMDLQVKDLRDNMLEAAVIAEGATPSAMFAEETGINAQKLREEKVGKKGKTIYSKVNSIQPGNSYGLAVTDVSILEAIWASQDRNRALSQYVTMNDANVQNGQNAGSLTTSGGVDDLIGRARAGDNIRLLGYEPSIRRLAHIMMELVQNKLQDVLFTLVTQSGQRKQVGNVRQPNGVGILENFEMNFKVDLLLQTQENKSRTDQMIMDWLKFSAQANPDSEFATLDLPTYLNGMGADSEVVAAMEEALEVGKAKKREERVKQIALLAAKASNDGMLADGIGRILGAQFAKENAKALSHKPTPKTDKK